LSAGNADTIRDHVAIGMEAVLIPLEGIEKLGV
jgi:hypothetical protein